MKIISCGSIVVHNDKLLIAKPYQNRAWNIPKGKMNPGENYYDAARRETLEECNIDIAKGSIIRDLGLLKYLKKKDLYLYLVVMDDIPKLKCNSFFIDENKQIEVPEMTDFKWIDFDDYEKYLGKGMILVFEGIITLIKTHTNKQRVMK